MLWLLPLAAFLAVYQRGLWCWFHGDDFSLLAYVMRPPEEFWPSLVETRAQGTFRPLSERIYFYLFYGWFGLDAYPYRLLVFVTQGLNILLMLMLGRRLFGGIWAASLAACVWTTHHSLGSSMTWSSAFNQVLCSFFFLAALCSFVRFADTRRMRWYTVAWMLFVLGFGALETMVVFPAVALAYAVLCAPGVWRHAVAMFAGSALFAYVQLTAPRGEGAETHYSLGLDAALLDTFGWYAHTLLVAQQADWIAWTVGITALGFALLAAYRGERRPLFALAVFGATLAPYLPLADHRTEYYLVLPALGLGLLAGSAHQFLSAYRWWWKVPAVWLLYLTVNASLVRAEQMVDYYQPLSIELRDLLSDVATFKSRHPNQSILLTGVPKMTFYTGVYHRMFRVAGVYGVRLAPDGNPEVVPDFGLSGLGRFFAPEAETDRDVMRGLALVLDVSGDEPRDVTDEYRAAIAAGTP